MDVQVYIGIAVFSGLGLILSFNPVSGRIPLFSYTKRLLVGNTMKHSMEKHTQSLKDKTIIVTGANSGIGFAAAKAFASRGASGIYDIRFS